MIKLEERVFDYRPRLVEANLRFLAREQFTNTAPLSLLWTTSRWWAPGTLVLDQGREGACVGFGCSGEAAASPVRQTGITNATASAVYHRAKELDAWEGVNYEGTSVRAGMLVGREKGWWDSFYWCRNIDDLRIALESGPVVIGVDWYDSMYQTESSGLVRIGGTRVGGHCLFITGYSPTFRAGGVFRWRNSWGTNYGLNGSAYIRRADLDRILFAPGNEAAVPVNRKLARP